MEKTDTGKPACCAPGQLTECTVTTDPAFNLPKAKQTALQLYATAAEAYQKWQAAPDDVMIIDVRTLEEFLFVGSPTMAVRIPVALQSYEWNAEKNSFPMAPLSDFVERVLTVAKADDSLYVLCRSGGRSAIACNLLAQAGFTKVYNIIDGMEGDGNGDSDSTPKGGWKYSRCPWTKKITPDQLVLPAGAK